MNKIEIAMSAAGFFFFIAVAALLPSSCRRHLTAVVSLPSLLSLSLHLYSSPLHLYQAAFGRPAHSSRLQAGLLLNRPG